MRVLLLNQFFWPDLAPTSQLLTDLATRLFDDGHEVTVICGKHGYGGNDCTAAPPVRIVRLPEMAFGRGAIARLTSYGSFLVLAALGALRVSKPDVVVSMTTPPLLSVVGMLVQKLSGARHYIWEMDLYPDIAIELGVLRREAKLTRAIARLATRPRRAADGIIALGECMRARLIAQGLPPEKIAVAENWADGTLLCSTARPARDSLTVVYPGNLGLAHDTDTLLHALRRMGPSTTARFVFVGGGARLEPLRATCERERITAASFLPYRTRARLNELMETADAGLVTLTDTCLGSVVPSKVYALMAAGLPIIYIGPPESTVGRLIDRFQCGWQVRCGDSEGLLALLARLQRDPASVREAGVLARQAFLLYYDKPVAVARLCGLLGLTPEPSPKRDFCAGTAWQ